MEVGRNSILFETMWRGKVFGYQRCSIPSSPNRGQQTLRLSRQSTPGQTCDSDLDKSTLRVSEPEESVKNLSVTAQRVYNVALFGVTGCGKGSIINLLTEKPVADVTTGAEACTMRARWYPFSIGEKQYRIWDTMGFNQPETEDVNPLALYEQAHALLQNLQDGVDLIFLCSRKDAINASLRSLYWLLNNFFFAGQVKIALVLTHFDTLDEQWWERNRDAIFQRFAIDPVRSLPHVCITTVQSGNSPPDSMYARSKRALESLVHEHAINPTPPRPNLLSQDPADLSANCQLTIPHATALMERFRLPKRPFNAVFFGETGAGKSSVINLIAGSSVAKVSSDIDSCTLEFSSYEIYTGSHQFVIWDTVGLNARNLEHKAVSPALENAARLIRELHEQGGVDLLVFCKKKGRITDTESQCYRLYQEFLCEQQVPVALIITHAEDEDISTDDDSEWWKRNGRRLIKEYNLDVIKHACITSIAQDDPNKQTFFGEKLSRSRLLVQNLLDDSITHGNAFARDERTWVMAFLKKVVGMVKVTNVTKKERISWRNLKERCGLSKEQAEELVKLLYRELLQDIYW